MDIMEAQMRLKDSVLAKSGIKNPVEKDCKLISEIIFQKSKNYISESSIKRLYGFSGSESNFASPFILNSLCQFIGFDDWETYKNNLS